MRGQSLLTVTTTMAFGYSCCPIITPFAFKSEATTTTTLIRRYHHQYSSPNNNNQASALSRPYSCVSSPPCVLSAEKNNDADTNNDNTKKNKKNQSGRRRAGDFWEARMDAWRPDINDVERVSWGKPAKKRGTGSRGVPHRLNLDERFLFDNARRRGFLEMDGSGWRSQRRDAPLLNTYRSLCDARGQASIVVHKGSAGMDELVVDISPLRNPEIFDRVAQVCLGQEGGGWVIFQGSRKVDLGEDDGDVHEDLAITLSIVDDGVDENSSDDIMTPWEMRPIYQLPPYCISWELPRDKAKDLGKKLAKLFDTIEDNPSPSKKPIGVKPGKSRRHGGYGIG